VGVAQVEKEDQEIPLVATDLVQAIFIIFVVKVQAIFIIFVVKNRSAVLLVGPHLGFLFALLGPPNRFQLSPLSEGLKVDGSGRVDKNTLSLNHTTVR